MLDKLHIIMDAACTWGNKNLGTSIRFPKPTKKSIVFSAFSSGIIGSAILIYGLFSTTNGFYYLVGLE